MEANTSHINHRRNYFLEQHGTYAIQTVEWMLIPPFWVSSVYFFIKVSSRQTIHSNMKVLLSVFPVSCLIFQISHNLQLMIVLDSNFHSMKPMMLHLGVLHMVGNLLMASNLQSFVVERYCAYKYMKSYELWGSRLAWTLVSITVLVATIFCYFMMLYGYQLVAICESDGPLSIFEYMLESMPVLPIITVPPCIFGAILLAVKVRQLTKRNRKIHNNRFNFTLSAKATVNETYLFLPSLLLLGYLHTSVAILYYTFGLYRIYRILKISEADMLGFLLQQFQHIIVEIYGFFFMLYDINTLPALKRAVYEDFYWLMGKGDGMQKPSVVLNDENTDERFKHLRDMWDGKLSDNT